MLSVVGYTVQHVLHQGRDTVLHGATRIVDGQRVVLKAPARTAPTPRERARLRYEFEVLREIQQPGVVKALALENSNVGPMLVMEWLSGIPLDKHLQQTAPSLHACVDMSIAIVEVVASVHRHRVVHKDLKPHHIFYDPTTGQIKILDFGIATRIGHMASNDTGLAGLEGTLAYLSPEQTGRVNLPVDRRSDLYSLGVVLYELFTRVLPFTSIDPMELVYCHVARSPLAPHVHDPRIPETLSAIIMKLLAKAPEDRYQSALGVLADLRECARMLGEEGTILANMKLGTRDVPYELQLSRKLYGRDRERDLLLAIFERVKGGTSELALISGYSGVGKTALVAEVRKALMQHGGFFAAGKFDLLNRNTPYSSLAHALRELLQQVLARGFAAVAFWRANLSQALGASASVLASMVPELDALLGPLPEAPTLGPAESQNRFDNAVDALIRAFCQSGQPLVLLLDDLQWGDPASLRLLQVLFGQGAPQGLLILGAYRDNEVDASHPLRLTMATLLREGATLHEIKLDPLGIEDLVALLVDTLELPAADVEPLGRRVFEKTQGNPFFAGQFVSALYRDGMLRFSIEDKRWAWDSDELARREVTDNVIDFMAGRLALLPATTRRTLTLAACIGHEFDLQTLAIICEQPADVVIDTLRDALQEGMILPQQWDHRYAALVDEGARHELLATYRFVHDRVHEAAHGLIDTADRAALRLRIGRLLLARLEGQDASRDDNALLFAVANHLNQGRQLITDAAERQTLAHLNLRAGQRARAAGAFATASEHYQIGLELLDVDGQREWPELHLQLLLGFAEGESLCGRFDAAEECFEHIDNIAPNIIARAEAICLRLKLYQVAGRYRGGVLLAEKILRDLDVRLPGTPEELNAAMTAEMADIQKNMAGRSIEALLDAPLVCDERIRVTIELLVNTAPCAYIGQPETFPFVAMKQLNLCLQHGNIPASCYSYSAYGVLLLAAFGDFDAGYRFSEMSMRLNEKFDDIRLRGTILHIHADYVIFWKKHIRTNVPILEKAFIACQQAGDYVFGNYVAFLTVWQSFELGEPLHEALADSERFARFSKKTRNDAVYELIRIEQQFYRCLMGQTNRPFDLDTADFDAQASQKICENASFGCGIAFGHTIDLILAYHQGDTLRARAASETIIPYLGAIMGLAIEATFHFYRALTLAQSITDAGLSETERAAFQATMTADVERLARWAASSPETFEAKYRIAKGESFRAQGNALAALNEFDAAIDAAETSGFAPLAGMACELSGRCLLTLPRPRTAAMYFHLAVNHYTRWGAVALVEKVEADLEPLRPLLHAFTRERRTQDQQYATHTITSQEVSARLLDVATALKAAQAIASEIEMGGLLEKVMEIVLKHSGAQRAVLVLAQPMEEGELDGPEVREASFAIAALATIEPAIVRSGLWQPIEGGSDIAASIVGLVARTRETLIATNPHQDPKFLADSYLQRCKPRSVLCVPLVHQGQLGGLIYLENDLVRDAFTRERIDVLHLLCAQTAIALENARLYQRVHATSAALHDTNARLEADVAARTGELNDANQRLLRRGDELDAVNQRLQQELEERQRAEQERAKLQDEIIRTQQARLQEMGTPLIPISSHVVVMPLVGTVDEQRANQVLETALAGVQRSGARFLILDITGLHHIDNDVADTLLRTARALQLLGTVAIITGVRPDVAQTLIALNVDIGSIVCLSRLQDGIAHAQNQLRTEVTRMADRAKPRRPR